MHKTQRTSQEESGDFNVERALRVNWSAYASWERGQGDNKTLAANAPKVAIFLKGVEPREEFLSTPDFQQQKKIAGW